MGCFWRTAHRGIPSPRKEAVYLFPRWPRRLRLGGGDIREGGLHDSLLGTPRPSNDENFDSQVRLPLVNGGERVAKLAGFAGDAFSSANNPTAYVIRPYPVDAMVYLMDKYKEMDSMPPKYNEQVRRWNAYMNFMYETMRAYNNAYERRVDQMISIIQNILLVDVKRI
ncbi:hypothetical protein N7492_007927 [Penicillium capsulatum]|uniref:Uncharacterized protein n=1 Tax=Penicillium capsulatum TaxID=69766 RepID=A0A9W9I659_9EURO|nr:hypothetical protein N7492_007927 [Penicillium capsulatum]